MKQNDQSAHHQLAPILLESLFGRSHHIFDVKYFSKPGIYASLVVDCVIKYIVRVHGPLVANRRGENFGIRCCSQGTFVDAAP